MQELGRPRKPCGGTFFRTQYFSARPFGEHLGDDTVDCQVGCRVESCQLAFEASPQPGDESAAMARTTIQAVGYRSIAKFYAEDACVTVECDGVSFAGGVIDQRRRR